MGVEFLYVNTAKRQYLSPAEFGINSKLSGLMHGPPAFALGLLFLEGTGFLPGRVPGPTGLIGSWVGDPLVVATDESDSTCVAGLETGSRAIPDRNLHLMAEEDFESISYRSMAMLAHWSPAQATALVRLAEEIDEALVHLGHAIELTGCRSLREAARKTLGADWRKRYERLAATEYRHLSLGRLDLCGSAPEARKRPLLQRLRNPC